MKTKTQKHWFEKFYDFMSNFIFGWKRTVLALIILISLNIHGQEKNNEPRYYDYMGTDGSKGYVSVNYKTKDIQLVNIKDSIQAIKLLYKAYRQMSYEADMYRWELIQIEKSKTNLKQKKR